MLGQTYLDVRGLSPPFDDPGFVLSGGIVRVAVAVRREDEDAGAIVSPKARARGNPRGKPKKEPSLGLLFPV